MDLSFDLEGTVVVITGAGGQIGQVLLDAFLSAGCLVAGLDIKLPNSRRQEDNLLWLEANTTDEDAMARAWRSVETKFHKIPTACICAAALDLSFVQHHHSITTLSAEQFRRTIDVVSRC